MTSAQVQWWRRLHDWADVIHADFQRVISRYLQNISAYLFCTTEIMLRTIIMQNSRLIHAYFPLKIDEVWIDRFCVRYDWWRRLQPTSSVSPVWTITLLRSLELLIKTPLLHMLIYINWLTHDFWTRTGGWELYRSHGAGTSSPSHWQHVDEQTPKPVGWTMCFPLMTLVPVQKVCFNIHIYIYMYIYIYMHSLYEFCYRRLYNGSVIQYWRSCTPSRSIRLYFLGERGSWAECHCLFSLVYQLCLALW